MSVSGSRAPSIALIPLFLLALCWAVPAWSTLTEVAQERSFSSDEIPADLSVDFGAIKQGLAAVLKIQIRNQGSGTLDIGAVRPLCACMSEESVRTIEAGAVGEITLRLDTLIYSGETVEAALIQWVDGTVPVTRIEMTMDVQPVIEISPRRLIRFRTAHGAPATEEIEIRTADATPFKITKVLASTDKLSTKLEKIEGAYRLQVTLDATAPPGMIRETITLHTDLLSVPELEIKITGAIKAGS